MKKLLKWLAIIVGVLVLLIVIAGIAVFTMSNSKMNKKYDITPLAVEIPTDSLSIAEGQRLFKSRGCADCHGDRGEGKIMIDNPAPGKIVAVNLTKGKGGLPASYGAEDFIRALRHGVGGDGRALVLMPSHEYMHYNDLDLGRIVAYIQTLDPADNELPATAIGPVFRLLAVTGAAPVFPVELIDHDAAKPAIVPVGATREYGEYLSVNCTGCHGSALTGGPLKGGPPGTPPAANLTMDTKTGLGMWTRDDFFKAMRNGERPDGTDIDPFMPWEALSEMTDTELDALWIYLQSLPVKELASQ